MVSGYSTFLIERFCGIDAVMHSPTCAKSLHCKKQTQCNFDYKLIYRADLKGFETPAFENCTMCSDGVRRKHASRTMAHRNQDTRSKPSTPNMEPHDCYSHRESRKDRYVAHGCT
jgi:hypothetical protein